MAETLTGRKCQACGRLSPSAPIAKPDIGSEHCKLRFTTSEPFTELCQACKKFYSRYRSKLKEEKCSCEGKHSNLCRVCRLQRYETAILGNDDQSDKSPAEEVDFAKIPCAVCGASSSGFHFGVVSCEGCKGFFRRSMKKNYKIEYSCKAAKDGLNAATSEQLCSTHSNCRKCRLQRCMNAGMSLQEVTIGRHTLRRRAEVDAAIRKHSSEGSFLTEKLFRRKRKTSEQGSNQSYTFSSRTSRHASGSVSAISSLDIQITKNVKIDQADQLSSQTQSAFVRASPVIRNEQQGSMITCQNTSNVEGPSQAEARPTEQASKCDTEKLLADLTVEMTSDYDGNINSGIDDCLNKSCDWFCEQAIEATVRLGPISELRIALHPGASEMDYIAARVGSHSTYMQCVCDFIIALPGINRISMPDRTSLFAQAYFPIVSTQMSLHFDIQKQLPNHFSLVRDSPAWNFSLTKTPAIHVAVENFLVEVGNRFASAVTNLPELSLFCALLLFNPSTPNLENVDAVRSVRHRYDLALHHHLSNGARSEQRLANIYQLLPFFRRATELLQFIFGEANTTRAADRVVWTPLFNQLESQVSSLSSSSGPPSTAPPRLLLTHTPIV